MIFENLNSLETLNIQNNKLTRIQQDIMEHVIDTLRIIDITGKCKVKHTISEICRPL